MFFIVFFSRYRVLGLFFLGGWHHLKKNTCASHSNQEPVHTIKAYKNPCHPWWLWLFARPLLEYLGESDADMFSDMHLPKKNPSSQVSNFTMRKSDWGFDWHEHPSEKRRGRKLQCGQWRKLVFNVSPKNRGVLYNYLLPWSFFRVLSEVILFVSYFLKTLVLQIPFQEVFGP